MDINNLNILLKAIGSSEDLVFAEGVPLYGDEIKIFSEIDSEKLSDPETTADAIGVAICPTFSIIIDEKQGVIGKGLLSGELHALSNAIVYYPEAVKDAVLKRIYELTL